MAFLPLLQGSSFTTRRNISLACFCSWMLLNGITYSVILSSFWFYIKWYNATNLFYGFVLCVFSISGALTSPFFIVYDNFWKRTRLVFLISCFLRIIGLLVYSLSFSKYLSLIGLAICGVGGSVQDALFGELAKITNSDERTKFVSLLDGARLLGFAVGPCLCLLLGKCHFFLGSWNIFFGNCPSLFACVLWCLLCVTSLLFLSTLSNSDNVMYEKLSEITAEFKYKRKKDKKEEEMKVVNEMKDKEMKSAEKQFSQDGELPDNQGSHVDSKDGPQKRFFPNIPNDLGRAEIVVLLWVQFFLTFLATMFITMLPPLANGKLVWNMVYISVIFITVGCFVLITVAFINVCPYLTVNRQLILCTWGTHVCLLPLLFLVAYSVKYSTLSIIFVSFVVVLSITYPLIIITVRFLITKLSSERDFAFNQFALSMATSFGGILGPVLGVFFVDYFLVFSIVLNVFNVFSLISIVLVYRKLKIPNMENA